MGQMVEHIQSLAPPWRRLFLLTMVVALTLLLHLQGLGRGDFWTSDDARHALDGVFILDFFRDLPLSHPIDYLVQYYAKYPALGIGNYPPFFALIEALVFAVAGISFTGAKATVVLFSLLAASAWFRLIAQAYDEGVALWSTLLFVTSPFIVTHAQTVMLEMPALAMVIIAISCWYSLLAGKTSSSMIALGGATLLAILTKQTAIFLVPVYVISLGMTKGARRILTRSHGLVAGFFFLLLAPLAGLTMLYGDMHFRQVFGKASFWAKHSVWYHLSFYPWDLLKSSWPIAFTGLLFLVYLVLSRQKMSDENRLFAAWLLVFYAVFSAISVKTSRYGYFAVPPLTLFAVLGVRELLGHFDAARLFPIVLLLPVCWQTYQCSQLSHPDNRSYREAAELVVANGAGIVFFHGDGAGTGSFIFHIRQLDIERKMIVYRSDKILASSAMDNRSQLEEYVDTADEISQLFDSFGIQYFVTSRDHFGIRAYKELGKVWGSGDFSRERGFFEGRGKRMQYLDIYKKKTKPSPVATSLMMKLPIAGVKIEVSLVELAKFYTPGESRVVRYQPGHEGPRP